MDLENPDLIHRLMSELGPGELDNRRVNIWNSLRPAIEGNGKIFIIAYGNVVSMVDGITLANGRTYRPWPAKHDPSRGIALTLVEWLQLNRGEYVYDSELDLAPWLHLGLAEQLIHLERAASADIAAISLGVSGALRWYPSSSPLPRPSLDGPVPGQAILAPYESGMCPVIVEEKADYIASLSAALDSRVPTVQDQILGAMEWYRLGEETRSSLNSFLCHWIAIERLAYWWFDRLGKRVSDEDFLDDLANEDGITVDRTGFSLTVSARSVKNLVSRASKLNDRRNYTARRKITEAFRHVWRSSAQQYIDNLYEQSDKQHEPLKNLRDDIAHGNVDEISVRGRAHIASARQLISDIDRRFLLMSIEKLVDGK